MGITVLSDGTPYDNLGQRQVLTYPPLETPPPLQYEVARLTITKVLASGNSRGAQVLLCSIRKPNAEPFTAIAKIFDPLYYSSVTDIACSPFEVVDLADGHYSREAAAYEFSKVLAKLGPLYPNISARGLSAFLYLTRDKNDKGVFALFSSSILRARA